MKKAWKLVLCLLVALSVLLFAAACGGGNDGGNDGGGGGNDSGEKELNAAEIAELFSKIKMPSTVYSINANMNYGDNLSRISNYIVVPTAGNEALYLEADGGHTYIQKVDGQLYAFSSRSTSTGVEKTKRKIDASDFEEMKKQIPSFGDYFGTDLLSEMEKEYKEITDFYFGEGTYKASLKVISKGSNEYPYHELTATCTAYMEGDALYNVTVTASLTDYLPTNFKMEYVADEKSPKLSYKVGNKQTMDYYVQTNDVVIPTINPSAYVDETNTGSTDYYFNLKDNNASLIVDESPIYFVTVGQGQTATLPVPTCEGLTFEGWYYDYYANKQPAGTTVKAGYESGYSLYAKWSSNTVVELNGGKMSYEMDIPVYSTGAQYEDDLSNYCKKFGYEYDGLYTDAAFTQALDEGTIPANTKIYVKWVKSTVVTQVTNADDLRLPKKISVDGKVRLSEEFERKGYLFEGWYKDAAFTQKIENRVLEVEKGTADFTVYAKFTECYSLSFSVDESQAANFKIDFINVPKTEVEGYGYNEILFETLSAVPLLGQVSNDNRETVFVGWYTDAALTQKFSAYPTQNLTLYPKLAEKQFITWEIGDGTFNSLSTEYYKDYALSFYFGLLYNPILNSTSALKSFSDVLNEHVVAEIQAPQGKKVEGFYYDAAFTQNVKDNAFPLEATTIYVKYKEIEKITITTSIPDEVTINTSFVNILEEDYEWIRANGTLSYSSFYAYLGAAAIQDLTSTHYFNFTTVSNFYNLEGWYIDPTYTTPFDASIGWPVKAVKLFVKFSYVPRIHFEVYDINNENPVSYDTPISSLGAGFDGVKSVLDQYKYDYSLAMVDSYVLGYFTDPELTIPYVYDASTEYPTTVLNLYVKTAASPTITFVFEDDNDKLNSGVYFMNDTGKNLKELYLNNVGQFPSFQDYLESQVAPVKGGYAFDGYYSTRTGEAGAYVYSDEYTSAEWPFGHGNVTLYVRFVEVE